MNKEKIRTFRKFGVTLDIYDLNTTDNDGGFNLGYALRINRDIIFQGENFRCSPMHSIDSLETVKSILTFLTLKFGDTDNEYFDNYTEKQLEFMESDINENLRMWLYS